MPNVRVGDIRPNPFRDIENYPISETKIEELQASFKTTRVWPNVIARRADGTVEIAYGHHRLEAARRLYGDDYEFPLAIENLTDDEMFKMMASENMEVYAASAQVVQNTIESLVKAFAEGKVHLDKPVGQANGALRDAPSFVTGASARPRRAYTAETLRAYLGWTSIGKVKMALQALEVIEQGTLKREDFEGLTMDQARGVVETVHQAERSVTAKHRKRPTRDVVAVTREVAVNAARRGEGRSGIRSHAQAVIDREAPVIKKPKVADKVASELAHDIRAFWDQNMTVGDGRKQTRRAVMQAIAANQHAVGVRQWVGSLRTSLNTMTAINEEFIAALDNEQKLEVS